MIIKPEPLFDAIDASFSWMMNKDNIRVIYPSPAGEEWNQNSAEKLPNLVFCDILLNFG